jgi:hypothetical protein
MLSLVYAESLVAQAFSWDGLFARNWSCLQDMPGAHPFTDEDKYMRLQCSMQLSLAEWCGLQASPDVPGKWQAAADNDTQLFMPRRKARSSRGVERMKGAPAAAQQPAVELGEQKWCVAKPCAFVACPI